MIIKLLFYISVFLLFLILVSVYYGFKLGSNFKLYLIFGKKGTGKSTTLAMLAYKFNRKGYKVYCSDESIANTYTFEPSDFGLRKFEENSVILLDEVSLLWSNRDFRSFSKNVEKQLRYQRKDRLIIYMFSQTFDVDKKIRDLVDGMYLAEKKFNCVTWLKKISKNPTITEASGEGESRVTENLQFEPFWLFFLGTRKFVFIPKWISLFDSFSTYGWQREPIQATFSYSAKPRPALSLFSFVRKSAHAGLPVGSSSVVDEIDNSTLSHEHIEELHL